MRNLLPVSSGAPHLPWRPNGVSAATAFLVLPTAQHTWGHNFW